MADVNRTLHPQGDASTNVYPITKFSNLNDIPSVVNDRYLHTNSSTGAMEWSEMQSYSLPNASASTLGGVKVGSGLSIDANGVLSVSLTNANT